MAPAPLGGQMTTYQMCYVFTVKASFHLALYRLGVVWDIFGYGLGVIWDSTQYDVSGPASGKWCVTKTMISNTRQELQQAPQMARSEADTDKLYNKTNVLYRKTGV